MEICLAIIILVSYEKWKFTNSFQSFHTTGSLQVKSSQIVKYYGENSCRS